MGSESQHTKMPSSQKNKSIFWIITVLVLVAGTILCFRRPGQPLTTDLLDTARNRWKKGGVTQYSLTLKVTGSNEGLHEIEVKDSQVVRMSIDGTPVPQHVWAFWNVEGMFQFMADELSRREQPKATYGVENAKQVLLRAKFNAQYGYPERFMRHVHNQNISVEWEVLSFAIP
jgi:hypothetical protein